MIMDFVLRLSEEQRHRFHASVGQVIADADITRAVVEEHIPGKAIVVAVGDVTSATLLKIGVQPDIFLVDHSTRRGTCDEFSRELLKYVNEHEHELQLERFKVVNPKERIVSRLWETIRNCYQEVVKRRREVGVVGVSANKKIYKGSQQTAANRTRIIYLIEIQGEEDLGIIPAIIEAPGPRSSQTGTGLEDDGIRTVIIYGIPDIGIDILEPDEDMRKTAEDIVKHMEVEHGTRDSI